MKDGCRQNHTVLVAVLVAVVFLYSCFLVRGCAEMQICENQRIHWFFSHLCGWVRSGAGMADSWLE
jgi:hypothetical protein